MFASLFANFFSKFRQGLQSSRLQRGANQVVNTRVWRFNKQRNMQRTVETSQCPSLFNPIIKIFFVSWFLFPRGESDRQTALKIYFRARIPVFLGGPRQTTVRNASFKNIMQICKFTRTKLRWFSRNWPNVMFVTWRRCYRDLRNSEIFFFWRWLI